MSIPWEAIKKSKNAKVFLLLRFVSSMWFIEAVWYFYWGRFLSYTQVGMAFSWLVVVGLVTEIPTGYFADRYGRKASVVLGNILLGLGGLGTASAQNGWWLVVAVTIMSIGRAFISGALEALVYDDLKKSKLAYLYDKLVAFGIQVAFAGFLIAVPLGGFLYTVWFRLPNLLEAIAGLVALIISFTLIEVKLKDEKMEKQENLLVGFRELLLPSLRPYILPVFICITVFLLYDWGLSKPAMATNFGLDSRGQSIAYTIFGIINILAISFMPRLRKIVGDYAGIRMLNLLVGGAFIISTFNLGVWGLFAMVVIETMGNMGDPWTSSIINENVGSRYRATTLSTLALLTRIPHFFVNILAGSAIDGSGINSFHFGLGVLIFVITILATNYKNIFQFR